MVEKRFQADAFARRQDNAVAGAELPADSVNCHGKILPRELFLSVGQVHLDHQIATAPVDDIFPFMPVKVHRRDLFFPDHHYFLGIPFGILTPFGIIAVSDGEK